MRLPLEALSSTGHVPASVSTYTIWIVYLLLVPLAAPQLECLLGSGGLWAVLPGHRRECFGGRPGAAGWLRMVPPLMIGPVGRIGRVGLVGRT